MVQSAHILGKRKAKWEILFNLKPKFTDRAIESLSMCFKHCRRSKWCRDGHGQRMMLTSPTPAQALLVSSKRYEATPHSRPEYTVTVN